jgi:hypothetical protein
MPHKRLTRPERLALITAALVATVSGAVRALLTWLLAQLS